MRRIIHQHLVVVALLLSGCHCLPTKTNVNLEPNDPRPIVSVQVGDVQEAALLAQQAALEVHKVDGQTVYFFDSPAKRQRLEQLGYEIKQHNSYDMFRRVVRIDRSIPEAALKAEGIRIINREEQFFVIEATVGQLRTLVRSGAKITAVTGDEPRPRQIRIVVASTEDVTRIGALGVDIYSAKRERTREGAAEQGGKGAPIVVYGAAFDFQIDQLKDAAYKVEILTAPPSGALP